MKAINGQISLFDLSAKMGTKRHYPKGSLVKVDGCDYDDCFSCSGIGCQIRGENRYCRYATMGNPFPCKTILQIETDRKAFSKECQFINQSLAHHREGDHQPSPCCMECNEKCERRCKEEDNE